MEDVAVRVFVVSLERSVDRRAHMAHVLRAAGIAFEYFPAVDGIANPQAAAPFYDEKKCIHHLGRPLSPGELGCFLSHLSLWKLSVERQEPFLIMEDDIELVPGAARAIGVLELVVASSGLVRLGGRAIKGRVVERLAEGRWSLVRFPRRLVGTYCYAIAPSAAEKLVA